MISTYQRRHPFQEKVARLHTLTWVRMEDFCTGFICQSRLVPTLALLPFSKRLRAEPAVPGNTAPSGVKALSAPGNDTDPGPEVQRPSK